MKPHILSLLLACSLPAEDKFASNPPAKTVVKAKTAEGIEFGMWGRRDGVRQPTLIVLAGAIDSVLRSGYFRQCGNQLSEEEGWLCVSIDIPCHGRQVRAGESAGLSGWRQRVAKDEDFVAPFNRRLSAVLDHLIEAGITDPGRIVSSGTSRGGYLAIQFAASDQRVKAAAGFAPVTDLRALSEFRGLEDHALAKKLSLENQAAALAGRHVWIVIGDQDERVSTDRAIACARKMTAAKARMTLHLLPEPRGHTTPKGAANLAADWVRNLFEQSP